MTQLYTPWVEEKSDSTALNVRKNWRKDATRIRILKAADAVLLEQGLEALKIQEVADRAEIAFGTLYNYFNSKEDLQRALLALHVHALGQRCFFATTYYQRTEPLRALVFVLRMLVRAFKQDAVWKHWFSAYAMLMHELDLGLKQFGCQRFFGLIHAQGGLREPLCDSLWGSVLWMLVGCVRQYSSEKLELFLIERLLILMELPVGYARNLCLEPLPIAERAELDYELFVFPRVGA